MTNPFAEFQNDTIRVVRKDNGQVSVDLKAHVTPGLINLYDVTIEIKEGYFIERVLPNNRTERYEVLEANFHEKFMVIPAHYSLKVRKTTAIKHISAVKNVFNLTGDNARIYQHSIDNSINNIGQKPDALFDELREFIKNSIQFNTDLLSALMELENNKGKEGYGNLYLKFVSIAADHVGLIAPFLPGLALFGPQ